MSKLPHQLARRALLATPLLLVAAAAPTPKESSTMSKLPERHKTLTNELKKEFDVRRHEARRAASLLGTGVHVESGGLESDNYQAGVSGYKFDATGNCEFNDLTLRGGIIGNDALAEPVVVRNDYTGSTAFGVTVAGAIVVSASEPIPAGCTECVVTVSGRVMAHNTTAVGDQLFSSVAIQGIYFSQFPTGVGAGTANTSMASRTQRLTGLTPGGTVTVGLFASTGTANWAPNGANAAEMSASYLFLR